MLQKQYKNFELTFESQGMSYIYESELYKYYLPKKSVSIVKDGDFVEVDADKGIVRILKN